MIDTDDLLAEADCQQDRALWAERKLELLRAEQVGDDHP